MICPMQGNLVHIQEAVPSREEFLLPTLGPKLEKLGEEVRIGRGFQLLRCVKDASPACLLTQVIPLQLHVEVQYRSSLPFGFDHGFLCIPGHHMLFTPMSAFPMRSFCWFRPGQCNV